MIVPYIWKLRIQEVACSFCLDVAHMTLEGTDAILVDEASYLVDKLLDLIVLTQKWALYMNTTRNHERIRERNVNCWSQCMESLSELNYSVFFMPLLAD